METEREDYSKLNEKVTSLEEELNVKDRHFNEKLKALDEKFETQAKTIGSLMIHRERAQDVCLHGMLER